MALAPIAATRHPNAQDFFNPAHMSRVYQRHVRRSDVARPAALWLCLSAFALAACADSADKSTGKGGGTMIIASTTEPQTLFPPRASNAQDFEVIASVFDRLAEIGPGLDAAGDSTFAPRLATGWTWAKDSLSIAFALDPRIHWHDGAPLRAADVQFTFHAYTSPVVASEMRSLLGNIDSVTSRDSLTSVFWFKRRTPQQFMDATYSMFILPSHLLASIPDSSLVNAPFGRAPIGTGRFRFARWESKSRLEIVSDTANARGAAKLDRVIWTFLGDAGAAAVKLAAGEADFLFNLRTEDVAPLAASPQLRLERSTPLIYGFVGFNLRTRRANGPTGAPHPVFGDSRVRRALAMAVDRAKMVRSVLDSAGTVSLGPAPRALIPDTAALTQLPFDLVAAKRLLDSAGWTDTKGDGVRKHNGVPLAFELLVPSTSPTRIKLSILLQAAFKDVGANVTLQNMDGSALGPRLEAGDFDAWMGGSAANPGLQGLRQSWASRGASNSQRYASTVFDAALDSALTTFDARRARGYWARALQAAIDDAPSIWLYEERKPIAVHKRIRMAPMRADEWYANLADWSVDPTQRIDRDRIAARGAR